MLANMTAYEGTYEDWWPWIQRQLDDHGMTSADLSRATGITESVFSRGRLGKLKDGPDPKTVRAVAQAFGRNVREAFIAAGHFTAEELGAPWDARLDLANATEEQLLDELCRKRIARRRGKPSSTTNVDTSSGPSIQSDLSQPTNPNHKIEFPLFQSPADDGEDDDEIT